MARTKKESRTLHYAIGAAAIALLVATAAVASYMTRESMAPEPQRRVVVRENASQNMQVARRDCDDGNIVGTIGGGIAGGALGSEVGSGRGQTAATIGGTLGGAYLGKKYIPTNNATCN